MESKTHQQYLESKITPELLQFFSRSDALELVTMFHHVEPHKYMKPIRETSESLEGSLYDYTGLGVDLEYLKKEIEGRRVIEFGDREGTNERFFLELGASSYEASDPWSNTKGLDIDALTHLLRQPDESAIVCSFAVLCRNVLYHPYLFKKEPKALRRYQEELAKQIFRVTPKEGITLHLLEYEEDLINAGFMKDKEFYEIAGSGIKSYRKK